MVLHFSGYSFLPHYALTIHNLSPPVVFKQRSHPMIEKQSQSQRHKSGWWDPPCVLNSFISYISLQWQDTCRFSKNKSSHDTAIIVDDKTHFSWPCREGPPACCAFSVPILAVLATAVFFQFPFPGVIENAVFFLFPFPGVIENAMFFQFPFPVVIENAVFFRFPFPGGDWKCCVFPLPFLQRVRSPVFFQFPFSFPVPFPVPFADSLCFSKESALQLLFFKRQNNFCFFF